MEELSMSDKRPNPIFLNILLSVFVGFVSVVWFIRGEVILPNKGVFVDGLHARLLSLIVFFFATYPLLGLCRKRRAKLKDAEKETDEF